MCFLSGLLDKAWAQGDAEDAECDTSPVDESTHPLEEWSFACTDMKTTQWDIMHLPFV